MLPPHVGGKPTVPQLRRINIAVGQADRDGNVSLEVKMMPAM